MKRKVEKLYFGGIWKLDHDFFAREEARGDPVEPTVLFFLGDDYLLITRMEFDGEKLTKLVQAGYIYDVHPGFLELWATEGKSKKGARVGWRLVRRRYLELNEKGSWLRYVPTTIEDLEELGLPRVYFDTWIDTFEKQGSIVVLRPLVPDFG